MAKRNSSSKAVRARKTSRRRSQGRCPKAVGLRYIEEGVTTLADVYSLKGPTPLVCYIDKAAATIYLARKHQEGLRRALQVSEVTPGTWVIDHPRLKGQYQVVSIEKLDVGRLFNFTDAGMSYGYKCTRIQLGQCLNICDLKTGEFLYSIKIKTMTEDLCLKEGTDYCGTWWRNADRELFRQPNCGGFSTNARTWLLGC